MKVVGYVRVSSREQFEEGYSIPAQAELVEKYCKDRGYKLLKVFQDVESGGKVYWPPQEARHLIV